MGHNDRPPSGLYALRAGSRPVSPYNRLREFIEFIGFIEFMEFIGFIEFIEFIGFIEFIEFIGFYARSWVMGHGSWRKEQRRP